MLSWILKFYSCIVYNSFRIVYFEIYLSKTIAVTFTIDNTILYHTDSFMYYIDYSYF